MYKPYDIMRIPISSWLRVRTHCPRHLSRGPRSSKHRGVNVFLLYRRCKTFLRLHLRFAVVPAVPSGMPFELPWRELGLYGCDNEYTITKYHASIPLTAVLTPCFQQRAFFLFVFVCAAVSRMYKMSNRSLFCKQR